MPKAQDFISKKIKKLAHEGYEDPKQRAAIAYSMARKKGYSVPKKKGEFKKLNKHMKY